MENRLNRIIQTIKKVKPQMEAINENTILNRGILDSLDVMLLVDLLEKEFDIKIHGICLKQENFETPVTLLNMISKIEE